MTEPYAWAAGLGTFSHPMRARILAACALEPTSPKMFALATADPLVRPMARWLPNVSYHFRELRRAGYLSAHSSQPRRGSHETFYEPSETCVDALRDLACQLDDLAVLIANGPPVGAVA